MAYVKPPLFVRAVFNKLAMKFGIGGAWTLTVRARRSGQSQSIPVLLLEHGGAKYLVSTRGESEWVRNLRAAGGGSLARKGTAMTFGATEVPVSERGPLIEAYKVLGGKTVKGYFAKLPDPADHPIFVLEQRT
ncbi:MAG: nitroreductase/quinone reductase family protein [Acidimicrobiia bacterium]